MKLARSRAPRAFAALLLALSLGALQGCATTAQPNPRDPWQPFNRSVYDLNEGLDRVLLRPTATWYLEKVPPLARTGVSNFFSNLGDAWSAVNSLLQLRLQDAEENLARFHVNTMFGVFGVFDVASDLGIERHREDFGQTLGRWGVPSGPFVMLPFFGPSTLRDAAALPVDYHYDPLRALHPDPTRDLIYGLRAVDKRANLLRVSSVVEGAALDKYAFIRDAYLQRRHADVHDGRDEEDQVPPSLPDESEAAPVPAPADSQAPVRQDPAAPAR